MTRFLARGSVLALACGLATNAGAQGATRQVPQDLVNALMGSLGAIGPVNTPEYFVGALPSGYPAALVPAGPVTVLGGARSGNLVVAVFDDSTRRLAPVVETLVESAGYARPATTPSSGFSIASAAYRFFCKDSLTVSVEPVMGAQHEMARVTVRRNRGQSCAAFASLPSSRGILKLPPLKPLPKTEVYRSGGSNGDEQIESNGVVSGETLEPSVLLAHYAAQLVQAGWTASTPAIGNHVAVQYLEALDDTGKHWEGTIMVSGSGTTRNLTLVMRSH